MVELVGIAPTSARLQRAANLSQLLLGKRAFHSSINPLIEKIIIHPTKNNAIEANGRITNMKIIQSDIVCINW